MGRVVDVEVLYIFLFITFYIISQVHPDADKMYIEKIDVGEAEPRIVCYCDVYI